MILTNVDNAVISVRVAFALTDNTLVLLVSMCDCPCLDVTSDNNKCVGCDNVCPSGSFRQQGQCRICSSPGLYGLGKSKLVCQ